MKQAIQRRENRKISYRTGFSSLLVLVGIFSMVGMMSIAVNGACTGSTNPPICDPLPNGNSLWVASARAGSLGGVIDDFLQDYRSANNPYPHSLSYKPSNSMSKAQVIAKYGPMETWDTSQVTNMCRIFWNKQTFNLDIRNWVVDNVVNMNRIFTNAYAFNVDLSRWIVSSATMMEWMFSYATAYTHTLCGNTWIESTADKGLMFDGAGYQAKIGTQICHCSPGKYLTTTSPKSCNDCTNGKYQSQRSFGGSSCTECKAGKYSIFGARSVTENDCESCPNGWYQAEPAFAYCMKCLPGKYGLPSDQVNCVVCSVETYQDQVGQTDCKTCDASRKPTLTGSTSCLDCLAGQFKKTNADNIEICSPCAAGTFTDESMKTECNVCDAGQYQPNVKKTACLPCLPGKFGKANGVTRDDCDNCAIGSASADAARKTSCPSCATGRETVSTGSTECLACLAGLFVEKNAHDEEICSPCGVGTYTDGSMETDCKVCVAGQYQPGTGKTSCLPCLPGKFKSDAGKTECVDCVANTFSKSPGSSSCAPCPTERTANEGSVRCTVCRKGKKKVTTNGDADDVYSCVACDAGFWSDSDSLDCTACPKGFHTAATNSESCKVCEAGRFGEKEANSKEAETACTECIAGTYSSANGVTKADDCIRCAPGKWSDTVGATLGSDCKECTIDYFSANEGRTINCEKCAVDATTLEAGQTICLKCNAGLFMKKSDVDGSKSCLACPSGSVSSYGKISCDQCLAGTFANADKTSCVSCEVGLHSSALGASSVSVCTECPVGTYSSAKGVTKADDCIRCAPGKWSDTVGATLGSDCKDCTIDYFSSDEGRTIICEKCAADATTLAAGQTICLKCNAGEHMKTTVDDGSKSCRACPSGFVSIYGVDKCDHCDAGKWSNVEKTMCNSCGAGLYSSEISASLISVCIGCPPGRYSSVLGVSSKEKCIACAPGRASSKIGTTSAKDCQACTKSTFTSDEASTSCKTCEQGKKTNKDEAATDCNSCDLGRFGDVSGCHDCPIGRYNDGKGQTECIPCNVNTYGNKTKSVSKKECTDCSPDRSTGTTKGNINSAACLCKRTDYYQDDQNECSPCPNGGDCSASDGLPSINITAQNGYWKASQDSIKFSDCSKGYQGLDADLLSKQRCNISNSNMNHTGDTEWSSDNQCQATYRGTLCLECIENYVRVGDSCTECQGGASLSMAFMAGAGMIVPIFIGVLVSLLWEGKTNKAKSNAEKGSVLVGQLKILLTFVQILSSMQTTYNGIPWPLAFTTFVIPLGAINLDIVGLFGANICSMAIPFAGKFLVHMSMPPMLAVGIVLAYLVSNCIKPPKTKELQHHRKAQTLKLLIGLVLFMYPGLATRCFQMFKCSSFHGVAYQVLEADPSMVCWEDDHTVYLMLSFVFICIYVIGIPLIMFVVLWRNKKHLYVAEGKEPTEKQQEVEFEFGSMYTQYEPKYWYFEIIIILHKCIMTGAMVIVQNGTPLQPLVAMLIQMTFLLLVLKLAPYNDDLDDWSSFVCSLALTLTTFAGFLLMIPKNNTGDLPILSAGLLTALLIGINALCFFYEMIVIGYVVCREKCVKSKKNEKSSADTELKTNKNKNKNKVQVLPIEDKKVNNDDDIKSWGT